MAELPKQLREFRAVYWTGMVAAIVWAVGLIIVRAEGGGIVPYVSMIIGLSHLAAMVPMAFRWIPTAARTTAGQQVQTAGYLHTLIGFSVVLTFISVEGETSMAVFLGPLGGALVTSIVGWFFGGELTLFEEERADGIIRSEASRLAAEIGSFAAAVRLSHDDYVRTMKGLSEAYESTLRKELNGFSSSVQSAAISHTEAVAAYVNTYSELEERRVEALEGAREASKQMDEHIRAMADRLATVTARLKVVADSLNLEELEGLTRKTKEAANQAGQLAEGLGAASSESRPVATYLREGRVLVNEV